jgi:hypothetical protein
MAMRMQRRNWGVALACLLGLGWPTAVRGSDAPAQGKDAPAALPEVVEIQVEGWTVVLDPKLFEEEHNATRLQALKALENHLQRVTFIVPAERVAELRKVRIWIDAHHPTLGAMQYHPDRRWLVDHGHDPRLVKHVHVPRARSLIERSTWAKHPYVILHELAHAYHDQFLGFDHEEIRTTYEAAKAAGIYEDVLLHTGSRARHYALTNHKEYFAELTEAYFGVNDFYPFVRAELREHDPRMYALLEKIWGPIK